MLSLLISIYTKTLGAGAPRVFVFLNTDNDYGCAGVVGGVIIAGAGVAFFCASCLAAARSSAFLAAASLAAKALAFLSASGNVP